MISNGLIHHNLLLHGHLFFFFFLKKAQRHLGLWLLSKNGRSGCVVEVPELLEVIGSR
jgi:hypothetical protein